MSAKAKSTTHATTGHCAMLQTVAKTDPSPTRSATATPMGSPKTTSTSDPSSKTTTASDMKMESPYTIQKGLSSSTSYITFIASITERNAPETPHRASAIETIAPKVKALSAWLWVMPSSWCLIKAVADSGTTPESLLTIVLTRLSALKMPRSESKKVKNGKIANSPLYVRLPAKAMKWSSLTSL